MSVSADPGIPDVSKTLTVQVITFNCARTVIDIDSFAAHLFHSTSKQSPRLPDLVVLSLQEVAPIAQAFLGGSFLLPFLQPFVKAANVAAGPHAKYENVVSRNVGMTAIMVLASPQVRARIDHIAVAGVGVGHWEMGNKGAVGVRLSFSDQSRATSPSLTVVAAHLAPMEDAWKRRNQDWSSIVSGLVFNLANGKQHGPVPPKLANTDEREPLLSREDSLSSDQSSLQGRLFLAGSPVFFAGDLNYRTRDSKPGPDEYKHYPQPSDDYSETLFKHDQLSRERKANHTLHHLDELPIDFPPTYKYADDAYQVWPDDGSEPKQWRWAKHRQPSWCDRILFSEALSREDGLFEGSQYRALPIQPTSDHRPVSLTARINWEPIIAGAGGLSDITNPFPLDEHWASHRAAARRLEILVGSFAYLGLTKEGNALLAATLVGAVGGYFVIRSLMG